MIPQLHIPVGPESNPYRAGAAADRRHFDAESKWAEWAPIVGGRTVLGSATEESLYT